MESHAWDELQLQLLLCRGAPERKLERRLEKKWEHAAEHVRSMEGPHPLLLYSTHHQATPPTPMSSQAAPD